MPTIVRKWRDTRRCLSDEKPCVVRPNADSNHFQLCSSRLRADSPTAGAFTSPPPPRISSSTLCRWITLIFRDLDWVTRRKHSLPRKKKRRFRHDPRVLLSRFLSSNTRTCRKADEETSVGENEARTVKYTENGIIYKRERLLRNALRLIRT